MGTAHFVEKNCNLNRTACLIVQEYYKKYVFFQFHSKICFSNRFWGLLKIKICEPQPVLILLMHQCRKSMVEPQVS
jgi:hypothetical protein